VSELFTSNLESIVIDKTKPRAYTNYLLDLLEKGEVDPNYLIRDLLGWMSEHDVRRFVQANDYENMDEE